MGRVGGGGKPPVGPGHVIALIAMLAFVVLVWPARGDATAASTPTPTATSSASATQSPAPTPSPTMDFATPSPLPSSEEFFGEDGRTGVSDYGNPAYTYDSSDDPGAAGTDSYLNNLLRDNADTVDIVVLLTLLALIPTMLIMVTGFTRIVIVLSFTRNALGTQNMPPNQVIVGLALFLSFFLMFPVLTDIQENALNPYLAQEITLAEAGDIAMVPIRDFMIRQTWKDDISLFCEIGEVDVSTLALDHNGVPEYPIHILIPAFLIGELKMAFWIGFCIYIPFIVIDMIVASTLMSMGMMMLPPVMISLPFKVLLFVSVDGWRLVIETLLRGFK